MLKQEEEVWKGVVGWRSEWRVRVAQAGESGGAKNSRIELQTALASQTRVQHTSRPSLKLFAATSSTLPRLLRHGKLLEMAQGAVKKSTSKPTAQKNSQRKQTGSRVIKPKKAQLQKQRAMKKKHTAGLTALTERSLAGRAGHLEMLGGGKKEKKAAEKKG